MNDPDRPMVEVTPEVAEVQEHLSRLAVYCTWFYKELGEWDIPDALQQQLTVSWLEGFLAYAPQDDI